MESSKDYTEEILPEASEQVPPQKKFNVFFIRHGKPVVASENYGTDTMPFDEFEQAIDVKRSMDLPLSEKGRQEIQASLTDQNPESLASTKLVISSPYLRTKQTAESVVQHIFEQTGIQLDVHESELLKEVEFDQNALTDEEYTKILSEKGFMGVLDFYVNNWMEGKQKGENIDDTYARAERFITYLRRVRKWTKHDTVFVSTHGWTGRIIKHVAEGGSKEGYMEQTRMLKTGEIFSFNQDDLMKLEGLGEDENDAG